jgi:hypothetical protein
MRDRSKILNSLEALYRDAYGQAESSDDRREMDRLDFQFQRDQLYLEAILDVRELLLPVEEESDTVEQAGSLLEKAASVRRLVRGR